MRAATVTRQFDPKELREPVYTKALWPGQRAPVPSLIVTTREADILHPHLQACGWAQFGHPRPLDPTGQLVITPDRLRLITNGTTIADGINPPSPPGWWKAIDNSDHLCAVVVLHDHHANLSALAAGHTLGALLNTDHALFAAVPVLT